MTRVMQYTDASTVGSVSDLTLGFGTAIARVTTRAALYDAITTLLLAAGFTQRNQATRDDTWTSTGETALESINFRTKYDASTLLSFYAGTKVDASGVLQGAIGGGNTAFDRWSIAADTTFDILALATKDFFWIIARRVSDGVHFALFLGNLERDNVANPNVMISSGSASAGSNVVVSVAATNPITMNYEAGDIVQIVSQATGDAALAETTQIISVTTSTIELAQLASNYGVGARIGALPSPIARFCGNGTDPDSATSWYGPLASSLFGGSDIVATPGQAFTVLDLAAGNSQTAQDGFGTATTPNKRTRRFGLRSLVLKASTDEPLGRVPGLYAYPGTLGFNPHDTGTFNRVTPTQRFLAAKFLASPTKYWMLGKAP